MLKTIEKCIKQIQDLIHLKKKIQSAEYKCEHYDTYEEDYKRCRKKLDQEAQKLEDILNEYIGVKKFLIFEERNRVKEDNDLYCTYTIEIIDNDSKEYYCVKSILDKSENVHSYFLNKDKYLIR